MTHSHLDVDWCGRLASLSDGALADRLRSLRGVRGSRHAQVEAALGAFDAPVLSDAEAHAAWWDAFVAYRAAQVAYREADGAVRARLAQRERLVPADPSDDLIGDA